MHSPLLGLGLSKTLNAYRSLDIGFFNTVLLLGIGGFMLFLYSLIRFISSIRRRFKALPRGHFNRDGLKVMFSVFCALMVGYATTLDFFFITSGPVIFMTTMIIFAEVFAWTPDHQNAIAYANRNFYDRARRRRLAAA